MLWWYWIRPRGPGVASAARPAGAHALNSSGNWRLREHTAQNFGRANLLQHRARASGPVPRVRKGACEPGEWSGVRRRVRCNLSKIEMNYEQQWRSAMIAVTLAGMTLEAFFFDYAADGLVDAYGIQHLDNSICHRSTSSTPHWSAELARGSPNAPSNSFEISPLSGTNWSIPNRRLSRYTSSIKLPITTTTLRRAWQGEWMSP